MNRRCFIKDSVLGGIALSVLSKQSFAFTKEFSINELTGRADTNLFDKERQILFNEPLIKFKEMKKAAKNEAHIKLRLASRYRNFQRQKTIWNNKFRKFTQAGKTPREAVQEIITVSTIPGTSRHHWGTDIDLYQKVSNSPKLKLEKEHFQAGGAFYNAFRWLQENAHKFGFFLVYTDDEKRKGFDYEPWHYTYKPLSSLFFTQYVEKVQIDYLLRLYQAEGILGREVLTKKRMERYFAEHIRDINPKLYNQ